MIKAFGKRLLVRIVEKEKKVGSLIFISDNKEFLIGKVYSVGPMCGPDCSGFDYAFFHKNSGLLVESDGVEYISIREDEILATTVSE